MLDGGWVTAVLASAKCCNEFASFWMPWLFFQSHNRMRVVPNCADQTCAAQPAIRSCTGSASCDRANAILLAERRIVAGSLLDTAGC